MVYPAIIRVSSLKNYRVSMRLNIALSYSSFFNCTNMKKKFTLAACITVLTCFSLSAVAQSTITFTGIPSDNDWSSPTNWDLLRIPQNGDVIIIPSNKRAVITQQVGPLDNAIIKIQSRGKLVVGTAAKNGSLLLTGNSVISLEKLTGQAGGEITTGLFEPQLNVVKINNVLKLDGVTIYPFPLGGRGTVDGPARADNTTGSGVTGFVFGALPVVLTSFEAVLTSNKQVSLRWTTAQEINTDHFTIERSSDGADWKPIINVNANGNSSLPRSYSATDITPLKGANLYHLRVVDQDGTVTISPVKLVRKNEAAVITVYPNPASDVINITTGNPTHENWKIRILNMSGQELVMKIVSKGTTTASIPINNLKGGVYFVQVNDGVNEQTNKVVIANR